MMLRLRSPLAGTLLAGALLVVAAPGGAERGTPRFLTEARSGAARDIALEHVFGARPSAGRSGLGESDEYRIESERVSRRSGATHIVLRQRVAGRDVIHGDIAVHVSRDGEVMAAHDRFVSAAARAAAPRRPLRSAAEALAAAAAAVGLTPNATPAPLATSDPASDRYDYRASALSRDPIPMRLQYLRRDDGSLSLVWETRLRTPDRDHYWNVLVDASTGVVLERSDWLRNDSYRVFAPPLAHPDEGPSTLEVDPRDATASPFGWHDTNGAAGPEFLDTRGNNSIVQEDADANDIGGFRPMGGSGLVFDSVLDLADTPLSQQPASVTNLFYWTNRLHDAFYAYGFDEAAGNFQTNNYGRGGLGGDALKADTQDGAKLNNAQFLTMPDGSTSELEMFLFGPSAAQLLVEPPSSIAAEYPAGDAEFGPALISTGPFEVAAALDAVESPGTATDACSPILNGTELAGRIALVDRGVCDFVVKLSNVQAVGAVAAIIVNNAGNRLIEMGGIDPGIVIPSVFVSQSNGALLREALNEGVMLTLLAPNANLRRDSSFSNTLVAHEYTHGVSMRLTGGPVSVSCLDFAQAAGMGEGWSDFFAIALTARDDDTRDTPRAIGTYAFGEPPWGSGFRNYQFSSDFAVNPQTYSDVATAVIPNSMVPSVHSIGEIWANALWEVYWNLVDDYGFDPDLARGVGGNNLAMQLVVDGMALQPCQPTFVSARNAILLADQALTGGANECAIWRGFARRGMGESAFDGGSASATTTVTDGFDAPMACPEPGGGLLALAALSVLATLRRRLPSRAPCPPACRSRRARTRRPPGSRTSRSPHDRR